MAKVRTVREFLNIFGSIQRKFTLIGGDERSPSKTDVFEYEFQNDVDFFSHFQQLNVKTDRGQLIKGKTQIGSYERKNSYLDRPRPRLASKRFLKKQNGN